MEFLTSFKCSLQLDVIGRPTIPVLSVSPLCWCASYLLAQCAPIVFRDIGAIGPKLLTYLLTYLEMPKSKHKRKPATELLSSYGSCWYKLSARFYIFQLYWWNYYMLFTVRCYAEHGYATRSCLSACPSVFNVKVPWSHRLEYFESNFTPSRPNSLTLLCRSIFYTFWCRTEG